MRVAVESLGCALEFRRTNYRSHVRGLARGPGCNDPRALDCAAIFKFSSYLRGRGDYEEMPNIAV